MNKYVVIIHQRIHDDDLRRLDLQSEPLLKLRIVHFNVTIAEDTDPIYFHTPEKARQYVERQMRSLPLAKYGYSIVKVV